ncbi:DUF4391 domain-containing protein [Saccharibacillus qingshengii]|uniref:DUF4391 domain-containing protein n=1 Tax=Saccharibacillus qingshengii TaxID=1763540 RepID=UPI00155340BB|nr:DUF4391 domain-containing protein [Saccharibacillus qingshengii]
MRFKLPPGTRFGRKIPKTKFYEKLQAGSNLKELFVEQVDSVVWAHNLSARTVHLEPADGIEEIQIFEIELRQRKYSTEILRAIDRAIPYPILYVLRYESEEKLAIAYKERSGSDENRSVIRSYHETPWRTDDSTTDGSGQEEAFEVLRGLNLKAVYEHIVRSLVLAEDGSRLGGADEPRVAITEQQDAEGGELPLEELLERQARIEALQRECDRLEAKMRREKQFNRKVELNMELRKKQQELAGLSGIQISNNG